VAQLNTGHVQFLISYTLRADIEEEDYDAWAQHVAVEWWQDQLGFRAIRGFYTLVGAGARIYVEIDFDHLESLTKVLGTARYAEMRRELNRFAEQVDARILARTGRTPD
jgi:hypothetical protein